ncbi:MAG TPA: hypothetical protein VMW15_00905 [Terracidiphilus sp.]|nr:hypothetical protein [Terracidiphilus sp.]
MHIAQADAEVELAGRFYGNFGRPPGQCIFHNSIQPLITKSSNFSQESQSVEG